MRNEQVSPEPGRKTALQSLEHAVALLEAMSAEGRELGVMELSRLLDMPKSTVHRLLSTLRDHRFVEQSGNSGKYRLGLKLWELGCGYVAQLELWRAARPSLEWLTLHSGESSHLAVFDRGEAVYVHLVEADRPMRPFVRIGARTPAHCTAAGKVLLAHQDALGGGRSHRLQPGVLRRPHYHRSGTVAERADAGSTARIRGEQWRVPVRSGQCGGTSLGQHRTGSGSGGGERSRRRPQHRSRHRSGSPSRRQDVGRPGLPAVAGQTTLIPDVASGSRRERAQRSDPTS